jgi:DNA-binding transcriptional ArsR family regulator
MENWPMSRGNFFIIENSVIDHYLKRIGPIGFALYSCLNRYSGDQRCTFVGTRRMAESVGVTPRTLYRHLGRLEELGLVEIERSRKAGQKTVYRILKAPQLPPDTPTLFDQVTQSSSPSLMTPVSLATPELVTLETQLVTPVSRVCDASVTSTKEEQDCFNKTHYQDKPFASRRGGAHTAARPKSSPKPETLSPHAFVESTIKTLYRQASGMTCPWNGRTGKVLKDFLETHRTWPNEAFSMCISNRFASEGISTSEDPVFWISKLASYHQGPKDKFGKTKLNGRSHADEQRAERLEDELEHGRQYATAALCRAGD